MTKESWTSFLYRWYFNFFPAYRGTGGRVTYISHDWRELHVKLPLNWRTRNYVGTIYGGSMYSCVDPMYMLMLIKTLGKEYVVWDKAATIRFKKPGRSTLYAKFLLLVDEEEDIRQELEKKHSIDRIYNIELKDENGEVHAEVEKTIYLAKKTRKD